MDAGGATYAFVRKNRKTGGSLWSNNITKLRLLKKGFAFVYSCGVVCRLVRHVCNIHKCIDASDNFFKTSSSNANHNFTAALLNT